MKWEFNLEELYFFYSPIKILNKTAIQCHLLSSDMKQIVFNILFYLILYKLLSEFLQIRFPGKCWFLRLGVFYNDNISKKWAYLFVFAWGCDLNQDFPIIIRGKENRLHKIILWPNIIIFFHWVLWYPEHHTGPCDNQNSSKKIPVFEALVVK